VTIMQWARGQWDRVAAWIAIGVGALALMLGWLGVRSEALTQKQIPYIVSGGLGGLLLVGVGAMLWLSADLRDEWRKLDAIERELARHQAEAVDDPFVRTKGSAPQSSDGIANRSSDRGVEEPEQPSRPSRRSKRHASS
jgi:hypothetical protein